MMGLSIFFLASRMFWTAWGLSHLTLYTSTVSKRSFRWLVAINFIGALLNAFNLFDLP